MQKDRKRLGLGIAFLALFMIWTVLVKLVDVQTIGPDGSSVGFAALNGWFHRLTGVHWNVYTLTDLLEIVPFVFVALFGVMGLLQWIGRKNLWKVDGDIIVLGVYFLVILALYFLFEKLAVNYRPVLIEGKLEASFPSSTTVLVLTVMPAAMEQLSRRMKAKIWKSVLLWVLGVYTVLMAIGRLISGVHWLTDIFGGAYLSVALLLLYRYACGRVKTAAEK